MSTYCKSDNLCISYLLLLKQNQMQTPAQNTGALKEEAVIYLHIIVQFGQDSGLACLCCVGWSVSPLCCWRN